jgi:16S rRNA (guanine966-N2)-methyltransferase
MEGIRIIAGDLKGRVIPFVNRRYDDADITTQKVKGAIFSMVGEWLHGKSFLDLYAGSGQVGLEALSRGAAPVVFNESDPARYRFIQSCVTSFGPLPSARILNCTAEKALRLLRGEGAAFDYIFLDPPYQKEKDAVDPYRDLMETIGSIGLLSTGGEIIVQHYSDNTLDTNAGRFSVRAIRRYGKTSLTVFA